MILLEVSCCSGGFGRDEPCWTHVKLSELQDTCCTAEFGESSVVANHSELTPNTTVRTAVVLVGLAEVNSSKPIREACLLKYSSVWGDFRQFCLSRTNPNTAYCRTWVAVFGMSSEWFTSTELTPNTGALKCTNITVHSLSCSLSQSTEVQSQCTPCPVHFLGHSSALTSSALTVLTSFPRECIPSLLCTLRLLVSVSSQGDNPIVLKIWSFKDSDNWVTSCIWSYIIWGRGNACACGQIFNHYDCTSSEQWTWLFWWSSLVTYGVFTNDRWLYIYICIHCFYFQIVGKSQVRETNLAELSWNGFTWGQLLFGWVRQTCWTHV